MCVQRILAFTPFLKELFPQFLGSNECRAFAINRKRILIVFSPLKKRIVLNSNFFLILFDCLVTISFDCCCFLFSSSLFFFFLCLLNSFGFQIIINYVLTVKSIFW